MRNTHVIIFVNKMDREGNKAARDLIAASKITVPLMVAAGSSVKSIPLSIGAALVIVNSVAKPQLGVSCQYSSA